MKFIKVNGLYNLLWDYHYHEKKGYAVIIIVGCSQI